MTKELAFRISALGGSRAFEEALLQKHKVVGFAATKAYKDGARYLESRGRRNIARAGFGTRWQRTWKVDVYPRKRQSVDPAIWAYHKIKYAGVFEYGAEIKGKPYLWVPTNNSPAKIGRFRVSPRRWEKLTKTPLSGVSRRPGATPILVAPYRKGRGKNKANARVNVPVFAGIRSATQKKRFDLTRVFNDTRKALVRFYLQRFKEAQNQGRG